MTLYVFVVSRFPCPTRGYPDPAISVKVPVSPESYSFHSMQLVLRTVPRLVRLISVQYKVWMMFEVDLDSVTSHGLFVLSLLCGTSWFTVVHLRSFCFSTLLHSGLEGVIVPWQSEVPHLDICRYTHFESLILVKMGLPDSQ